MKSTSFKDTLTKCILVCASFTIHMENVEVCDGHKHTGCLPGFEHLNVLKKNLKKWSNFVFIHWKTRNSTQE
jgi:hypothetical protein